MLTATQSKTSHISEHSSERMNNALDSATRITAIINHLVHALAKHWLLIVNTVIGLYAGLPVLAPLLMATGHVSTARLIYKLFIPLCHQLPERSFFLLGPQASYTLEELVRLIGPDVPADYVGSAALGYKMAVCQRDFATFLAALLAGLAFTFLRNGLKPLSLKAFAALCIPMALDGFGQLLALWESTWWSRVISGSLFGVACVWLAYPYIESGMKDVLRVMKQRPEKEIAF